VRIGIIGTGFGDRAMAPAFDAHPGCTVVEVVSARDDAAAAALCRRTDLDLVAVHSPPFLHERDVLRALEAGHHVLCDKPFGLDEAAARRMADAAAQSGLVHLLNFEFRYEGWRRALAGLVATGELGRPTSLVWHEQNTVWSRWKPGSDRWQLDRSRGGGWLGAAGSHVLDTIRWVLRSEPTAVTGVLHAPAPGHGDADVGASFHLEFGDRTWATGSTNGVAPVFRAPHVVLNGTEGTAVVLPDGTVELHRPDGEAPSTVHKGGSDSFEATLSRWVSAVYDGVTEGLAGLPTFVDGLACASMLERIRG
jgi:predicted dehydrogenase